MLPYRAVFLAIGVLLIGVELIQRRSTKRFGVAGIGLMIWSVLSIAIIAYLWINQTPFPLNLDLMEGTVLQHVQRLAQGQPVYPAPTADFVALAYNPLYYVVSVPFTWVFGMSLPTLRLVSILATVGSGVILYLTIRRKTGSVWWALIAVGLFAAAYSAMDAYLNIAHSDACFLFAALLGTYILDAKQTRGWRIVGILVLISAFWFKQHGALFVIGGVLYLTWKEGLLRSLIYWVLAALLGPVLYVGAGPLLFGSQFLYFTWQVPRQWSEVNLAFAQRYLIFIAGTYGVLAASGGLWSLWAALRERKNLSIWHVQFAFALLSGLMGTLDPGSSNNVYIPMGMWFILVGVWGLHEAAVRSRRFDRYRLHLLALFAAFALLLYNPVSYIVPANADAEFADLVQTLTDLNGNVYAPWLGELQSGYDLSPRAQWVGLDDIVRGPGRDEANNPVIEAILDPVLHPGEPMYILANYPLDTFPPLSFLVQDYTLETDYGDRFAALSVMPKRFYHGYPRYLYRYNPETAAPNTDQ